jgi:hypothetical protein
MSVTQVWDRLFVGGIADAEQISKSNPFGITTVITLGGERVNTLAPLVNYLYFPVRNSGRVGAGRFDQIMDALGENLRWGKVLLHCKQGTNRSPVIAAAWMHVVGYRQVSTALKEIGRLRTISPSRTLLSSVKVHL